jgi:hypothetical protein
MNGLASNYKKFFCCQKEIPIRPKESLAERPQLLGTIIGRHLIGVFIFWICFQSPALAWNDEQILKAIYLAEGGSSAQFPYGIRSVKCATKDECRQICKNTIRNNRRRYAKNPGNAKDFISYLGSRYCPTGGYGGKLSKAEKKLNKNWDSNVRFFLAKNARRK